MADLVTRIILNDSQFNDNIAKSKKQISDFEKVGGLAKAGLAKLTLALGAAGGGYEILRKSVYATEQTQDKFEMALAKSKGALDFLTTALSTADFSNFQNGLLESIRLAGDFKAALDTLDDRRLGYGIKNTALRADIANSRAILSDPGATKEEQDAALNQLKVSQAELEKITKKVSDDAVIARDRLVSNAANQLISKAAINRIPDAFLGIDEYFNEYEKRRLKLEKISKEGTNLVQLDSSGRIANIVPKTAEAAQAEKDLTVLNKKFVKEKEIYEFKLRSTDTEKKAYVDLTNEAENYSQTLDQLNLRINKQITRSEKGTGGKGTVKNIVEIVPAGSLTEIEKLIGDAQKSLMNATTDEARRAADALIKDLESKKVIIEVEYKYTDPGKIGPVSSKAGSSDPIARAKDFKLVGVEIPETAVSSYSDYVRQVADQNGELIDSFYGISDVLSGVGSALGENGGQWLNWGANVLSTIGRAIPSIMALTSANTAAAAAGGAAAVAATPVVGPILAVAAIASIVGALASVPKFESGGIVGGSSYGGDKLLARVNSGEMILNAAQQNNLAAQLGGAGEVKVRIEGRDLVAIIGQETIRNSRR